MMDIKSVEIIKKGDGVVQLRISDGSSISSFIIDNDIYENMDEWVEDIFTTSESIIKNINNNE